VPGFARRGRKRWDRKIGCKSSWRGEAAPDLQA